VETPKELSEEEELKIKNYFTLKLKKNIIITQIEDEKLVGGLIINYEGKTIDGSLLTKQESLKEYLKK
jgi:F0F1-type ATP synthase delta subunit